MPRSHKRHGLEGASGQMPDTCRQIPNKNLTADCLTVRLRCLDYMYSFGRPAVALREGGLAAGCLLLTAAGGAYCVSKRPRFVERVQVASWAPTQVKYSALFQ